MKGNMLFAAVLLAVSVVPGRAQSLKDLLNSSAVQQVAAAVGGTAVSAADLRGTWNYAGSACLFEGDDLLAKAGSAVIASQVEEQLNGYLSKMGIREGSFSYTFDSDSTFVTRIGGRTLKGTYTLDAEAKEIVFKYRSVAKSTAAVVKAGNTLSLLFPADKLLELLKSLSAVSNDSILKGIGAVADQYKGVKLGFKLQK